MVTSLRSAQVEGKSTTQQGYTMNHLRLVQDDGIWMPTSRQAKLYKLWDQLKAEEKTSDEVIKAVCRFKQTVYDAQVTMTVQANLALDLGDLEWGHIVATIALHRRGCWGDCDAHDRLRNDENPYLSVWQSKGKKYWIMKQELPSSPEGSSLVVMLPSDY